MGLKESDVRGEDSPLAPGMPDEANVDFATRIGKPP